MTFQRMEIEAWFDEYQFATDFDIGESGVKHKIFNEIDINLADLHLRYGHHRGSPELREQIAKDYPGLDIDQIAVTNGCSEAIFAVIASLVGPDDQIIVEHPNYPTLYEAPRSLERDMKFYHLSFDKQFQVDVDELEALIEPSTKLLVLTHPNNPTGSVISETDLHRIIELVESRGIYLLMDETYRGLTVNKSIPSAASLSPNAISVSSMSKIYQVPGIRIGWVAARKSIIDSVIAVREQTTICNSTISEEIALTLLKKKNQVLSEAKQIMTSNYKILKEWLKGRSDLEWVSPEGGVVAFPRVVGVDSSEQICRKLIEEYRTFVVPGYCFGMPEYLRIGFGGDAEELVMGLEQLAKVLDQR